MCLYRKSKEIIENQILSFLNPLTDGQKALAVDCSLPPSWAQIMGGTGGTCPPQTSDLRGQGGRRGGHVPTPNPPHCCLKKQGQRPAKLMPRYPSVHAIHKIYLNSSPSR